jgi:LPXTG-motif cell wall-anchored protein
VARALAEGQGVAAQGPIVVNLATDATVIQHLSFRSPQPAAPTPTAAPAAAPTQLPKTGGPAQGGWLALAAGLFMLACGVGLRFRRVRAR